MMNCPVCGQELALGAAFCQHCGTKLNEYCPICGKPLVKDARFCQYCGAQCGAAGPVPTQRPEEAAPAVAPAGWAVQPCTEQPPQPREAAAPQAAPAPCTASAAACAPEEAGASEPPFSAEPARPQEPSPAPAPVLEAPAPGLQPELEKQPAYYKAEFEKLSQGKKTDFNFAACFLGFWHTLYRGCWRRFLLLYSWLGVLTIVTGLAAVRELENIVWQNTVYGTSLWQWSRNVAVLAGLVLLVQAVVALYNGVTFNQYYYGVCKRGAADVEKRQICLVGGILASAAAAALVVGLAVHAYGDGREQGALYSQTMLQKVAVMGPQVQQALDESEVPASEEKMFLVGYIPVEELPDDLSAQGAGEQAMRSIRLFCDDDHTLGQVLDAAGVSPVFEGLAVQEDGSAVGGISCWIGETALLAKVVIWPDDGAAAKAAVTGAGFVNGQSQERLSATTNEAAALVQWLYRQAGMGDTPGIALRMQGMWVDDQDNYMYIFSSIIDGQDFQYHYVLREDDLLVLYVSNEDVYGVIGLTEDDVLVWGYAPRSSSELTTEIYERAQ